MAIEALLVHSDMQHDGWHWLALAGTGQDGFAVLVLHEA
jgi:hypothetical protein